MQQSRLFWFAAFGPGFVARAVVLMFFCACGLSFAALCAASDAAADSEVNGPSAYDEEQFDFVRNIALGFNPPIEDRASGSGEISFVGKVVESGDTVIPWQLSIPLNGGFGSSVGSNFGLMYRHAHDSLFNLNRPALAGANVFLGYEKFRPVSEFWRLSVGGEIRTGLLDLYGN